MGLDDDDEFGSLNFAGTTNEAPGAEHGRETDSELIDSLENRARSNVPGVPRLSSESWEETYFCLPVQYRTPGAEPDLALLLRPEGKIYWWILAQDGREYRIKKHHILFVWPEDLWEDGSDFISHHLIVIEDKAYEELDKINQKFTTNEIWEMMVNEYGSDKIAGFHLSDLLSKKFPEHFTYNPIFLYACNLYLRSAETYFHDFGVSGLFCRPFEDVKLRIERAEEQERENDAAARFVQKLKVLLETLRKMREREEFIAREKKTKREKPLPIPPPIEEPDFEFDPEHDMNFIQLLKELALEPEETAAPNPMVTDSLLTPLGYGTKPHDAFQLLCALGIYEPYDNPHLLRLDPELDKGYEESLEGEKEIFDNPYPRDQFAKARQNYEDMPIFVPTEKKTDFPGAGISIQEEENGEEWIYVHAPDASRYIPHDSRFCNALLTRGYTVNLPEKDFTLMPLRMSSLLSFQQPPSAPTPKLGITVAMRLHKDGHVLGYKVMPSSVKNFINTTYQEMDSVLLGVEESKLTNTAKILRQRYAQHLQRLEFFAERRRRLRAKRDAIIKSVPTHDVELRRDARDGSKAEVRIRINSDPFANARGIMTEFDILVNEIVADYGNKQGAAMFYLSQEKIPPTFDFTPSKDPLEDRIRQEQLDKAKKKKPDSLMSNMRIQRPEVLRALHLPHFGHGVTGYASILNPINSIVDLLNQHQLKGAIMKSSWKLLQKEGTNIAVSPGGFFPLNPHDIENHAAKLQERNLTLQLLKKNSQRYWILHNIRNDLERTPFVAFKALVIISRDNNGEATILLRKYELQAQFKPLRNITKGETIEVRVDHVDPFYDRLLFSEYRRGTKVEEA